MIFNMYNYNIFNSKDKLNERIEFENHLINKNINKNINKDLINLIVYLYIFSGIKPKL